MTDKELISKINKQYNVVEGQFTVKVASPRRTVGDIAGTVGAKGMIVVNVAGKRYQAHRLVWLLETGELPTFELSHIDGNRNNNKFTNLKPKWFKDSEKYTELVEAENRLKEEMEEQITTGDYDKLLYTPIVIRADYVRLLTPLGYKFPNGTKYRWLVLNTDLKKINSSKKVYTQCKDCGDIREVRAYRLGNPCKSCAGKGVEYTEEQRLKCSKAIKDWYANNDHPMKGYKYPNPESHPTYNHNLTDEDREARRLTAYYSKWVYEVKEKDNFTCQVCGDSRGGNLVSHHIESYNSNKELRTELSNGVCLCDKCHKEFHKKFGYGNNTAQQFEQFIVEKDD